MKTLKLFGLLILGMSFTLMSCEDDEDETMTIADIVDDRDDLSSLEAALDVAGLTATLESGSYTLFAPTDVAFANFLTVNNFASLADVPVDVLTNVLLNHVVAGDNRSTSLADGYVKTLATAQSNNVDMYINTNAGVQLNGGSNVDEADLVADNGVVHIVDAVIGLPTVVDFALADPTFEVLVAALTREASFPFVGILSGAGPFTVFAPTNDAFVSVLGELGFDSLADIPTATLAAVLTYHVVDGANVLAATLTDGQVINTLGGNLTVDITADGVNLIDGMSRGNRVVATDVQAANGVIHAVSTVLLP